MKKEIVIKIRIDSSSDEFANFIDMKGYNSKTPVQNTLELLGFLEVIKKQELERIFDLKVKE